MYSNALNALIFVGFAKKGTFISIFCLRYTARLSLSLFMCYFIPLGTFDICVIVREELIDLVLLATQPPPPFPPWLIRQAPEWCFGGEPCNVIAAPQVMAVVGNCGKKSIVQQ